MIAIFHGETNDLGQLENRSRYRKIGNVPTKGYWVSKSWTLERQNATPQRFKIETQKNAMFTRKLLSKGSCFWRVQLIPTLASRARSTRSQISSALTTCCLRDPSWPHFVARNSLNSHKTNSSTPQFSSLILWSHLDDHFAWFFTCFHLTSPHQSC